MNGALQGVTSNYTQYQGQLPDGILNSAVKSFLWSYSITFVLTGANPALALIGGAFGATASLIDSFTRPLFSQVFSNSSDFIPLILRKMIVISLIAAGASTMGSAFLGMSLMVKITETVVINLLFETFLGNQELIFRDDRVTEAATYFYFNFL